MGANVLPIINLPMALGNLPIAANGLPLVPIGYDIRVVYVTPGNPAFSLALCLKSGSHLPKKKIIICFFESPLKTMKNAFYFILKALFVLKTFTFLA